MTGVASTAVTGNLQCDAQFQICDVWQQKYFDMAIYVTGRGESIFPFKTQLINFFVTPTCSFAFATPIRITETSAWADGEVGRYFFFVA
jgi:hypothetical protein